jgi:hypothetical protein
MVDSITKAVTKKSCQWRPKTVFLADDHRQARRGNGQGDAAGEFDTVDKTANDIEEHGYGWPKKGLLCQKKILHVSYFPLWIRHT